MDESVKRAIAEALSNLAQGRLQDAGELLEAVLGAPVGEEVAEALASGATEADLRQQLDGQVDDVDSVVEALHLASEAALAAGEWNGDAVRRQAVRLFDAGELTAAQMREIFIAVDEGALEDGKATAGGLHGPHHFIRDGGKSLPASAKALAAVAGAMAGGRTGKVPAWAGEAAKKHLARHRTGEALVAEAGLDAGRVIEISKSGAIWDVVIIKAGRSLNNNVYSPEVLREAIPLLEGAKSFDNHQPEADFRSGQRRAAGELLGRLQGVRWDEGEQALVGKFYVYAQWLREFLVNAWAAGDTDILGLSIDAFVDHEERFDDDGTPLRVVQSIKGIRAVDVVIDPAAGGQLRRMVASMSGQAGEQAITGGAAMDERVRAALLEVLGDGGSLADLDPEVREQVLEALGGDSAADAGATDEGDVVEDEGADAGAVDAAIGQLVEQIGLLAGEVEQMRERERQAQERGMLEQALAASGLPGAAQDTLRELLAGASLTEADVTRAIEAQRKLVDSLDPTGEPAQNGRIVEAGPVFGVTDAELSLANMLGVLDQYEGADAARVHPMGLREWYTALTGDYNMHGRISEGRLTEANITTSTVTSIVKNALNKRVVKEFEATQAQRWWTPIVGNVDDQTINDVTEVVTAGFGSLSTVSEGAAYTELDFSDVEETASFVKRGNYVGITLETFMRDNLGKLRAIPRQLTRAFNYTVGSVISSTVFTASSGVGPTLTATSRALFNTTDNSRGSDDALSYAGLVASGNTMAQQTELGSGIQLGLRPSFLLVPPELYHTALQIRDSDLDPDNAENGVNTLRGTFEVVEVPLWTDANNWYCLASPNVAEVIVLHWYRGQRTPALFTADDERTGALFTNDEIRYKIRWWMAIAVADYRGAYGSIVA